MRGERTLGFADRVVCGPLKSHFIDETPFVVERLVTDGKLTRTLVAGLVDREVRRVELTVRGRVRRVPVANGAWLAVLDGKVRRADLVLRYRLAKRRTLTYDFARGVAQGARHDRMVKGSLRRGGRLPDPTGGLPFGLVTWREGDQNGHEMCVQAGRVVHGEVGDYEPSWGSFLDAPTTIDPTPFLDSWLPAATGPVHTSGCGERPEAYELGGLSALRLQRPGPGVVVATGLLSRHQRSVAFRVPGGPPARVIRAPGGAFLAVFASTGAPNETVELTVRGRKTRHVPIALGVHSERVPWETYEVRDGGRTLRLRWTGGDEPPVGVDGAVAFERVTVGLRERREPDYTDEGLGIAYSDIGIFRCADVQLAEPLGARAVFDAQTGKPGRAGPGDVHGPTDCPAFPLTGTPPPAR